MSAKKSTKKVSPLTLQGRCFTCKKPKTGKVVEVREMANGAYMLFAECPTCGTKMTRMAKSNIKLNGLKVTPYAEKAPNTKAKSKKVEPKNKSYTAAVVSHALKQIKNPTKDCYGYMATGGDLTLYTMDAPTGDEFLVALVNESKKNDCKIVGVYPDISKAYHAMLTKAKEQM